MDLRLGDKRALVTGGSRGIGKAVARQLALEGVSVAIAARDRARIDETVAELTTESGGRVIGVSFDAGDEASISEMVRSVAESLGGIDILVNGAARVGNLAAAPWDKVDEAMLYADVQVKILGYLRVAQAAAPYMIEGGWGRIINISGLAARGTTSVVGSLRNAAVVAMSKNLADELAPHGINVATVHPGMTRTEATTPEAAERAAKANLVGRMIDASEVADVITFLASPRSVAIDGDVIAAAGGTPKVIFY